MVEVCGGGGYSQFFFFFEFSFRNPLSKKQSDAIHGAGMILRGQIEQSHKKAHLRLAARDFRPQAVGPSISYSKSQRS